MSKRVGKSGPHWTSAANATHANWVDPAWMDTPEYFRDTTIIP